MIIEQAFHSLPEILLGNRYPLQDYEAGIVVVLTLAILQELNGRNVANPISRLQAERLYDHEGFTGVDHDRRFLRADLFADFRTLEVGNKSLDMYGWRHRIWLEAKFFRNDTQGANGHSTNKVSYSASLLADLVRLIALVPEDPGKYEKTLSGRYLLHIYDAEPCKYVAYRRNRGGDHSGFKREWLSKLHSTGQQKLIGFRLNEENDSFLNKLGSNLRDVELEVGVTNFVLIPLHLIEGRRKYWCVLTRIDHARIDYHQCTFGFASNRHFLYREGMSNNSHDYVEIKYFIGNNIGIKETETHLPDGILAEEMQAGDDEDGDKDKASNSGNPLS